MTSPAMTAMGMILGTATYMSPEQARGRPVDKRADIWAFGCVLYEMLTGRRVFAGDSVTDTLAKVIEREPDWTALPADTPAHVRGVIERCLRKDPSRRLRDIGDARLQLEEGPTVAAAVPLAPAPRAGWRLPIAVAAALVAGIAVGWLGRPQPPATTDAAKSTQLDLLIPTGFELFTLSSAKLAIAPDGSKVAYVAGGAGSRQVFVRALDEPASVPVRGTDAAFSLAFAPDGQSLVFLSRDRTLKRLSLRDGLVSDIATASGTNAPLWGVDGAIVFGRDGLWRVPAPGASPTRLTSLDTSRGEMAHTTGDVLPSGVVLFTSWVTGDRSLGNNEGDTSRIEAVNPADGVRRIVVGRASAPMYAATGHLLFLRDDAIMAVPFDARAPRSHRGCRHRDPGRRGPAVGRLAADWPVDQRHARLRAQPDRPGQPCEGQQRRPDRAPVGDPTGVHPAARVARWHASGAGAGRRLAVAARPVARRPHAAHAGAAARREFPDLVARRAPRGLPAVRRPVVGGC